MGYRSFLRSLAILVAVASVAAVAKGSIEIIDPHTEPAQCQSCHHATPTQEDVSGGEYHLLGGGIDETCHMCHPYDCCRIYALKGHNHPSNVGEWDTENFNEPRTLPLYDGLITCSTCHVHRKGDGEGYRMVRLVRVTLSGVDWTRLCTDCHFDI
ncbi:MAG: hypothetical protein JSV00_06995 [bacterium]|nr:MAG: hypothetical protein JSV00_06995 [bacterium]